MSDKVKVDSVSLVAKQPHEFVDHNGNVLLLKRIGKDRKTKNDFFWPVGGKTFDCHDWNERKECGGGIHAWPWAFGLGDGCDYCIIEDVWLVLSVKHENIVGEINGGYKCKAKCGDIVYDGNFSGAINMLLAGRDNCIKLLAASGDGSKLAASGYESNLAASGNGSACAACGVGSIVMVGDCGAFAIAYQNKTGIRFACGKVGERGIKAGVYYKVVRGKIVRANP